MNLTSVFLFIFLLTSTEGSAQPHSFIQSHKARLFKEALRRLMKKYDMADIGVVMCEGENLSLKKVLVHKKEKQPAGAYTFDPGYRMTFERSLSLRESVKAGTVDMMAPFIKYFSTPKEERYAAQRHESWGLLRIE